MEPSATWTTVTGPVGERLQAGTENSPVLDRNWDVFVILAPDINIQTYLQVTYQLVPFPMTLNEPEPCFQGPSILWRWISQTATDTAIL